MASSSVMASSSSSPSPNSIYPTAAAAGTVGPSRSVGSMSMEEFFSNIVGDNPVTFGAVDGVPPSADEPPPPIGQDGAFHPPRVSGEKTAEEVWREITAGGRADAVGVDVPSPASAAAAATSAEMTLEDYLTRSGVVIEDDVRVIPGPGQAVFVTNPAMAEHQFVVDNSALRFGNEVESGGRGGGRGGRGMKRTQMDPIDKAALQRQKRMIKNRESAARSRERKQAYTAELEGMVSQLEEENAQLLREQDERQKERLKQLRKNISVSKGKRKLPPLLRTHSL